MISSSHVKCSRYYGPPPYALLLLADETIEIIQRYIDACDLWVIADARKLLGVCAVKCSSNDSAEIMNIAIQKEYQAQGLGTRLIQHVLQSYLSYQICVGTPTVADPQIRFYERNGFRRAFVRKDYYLQQYPHPIMEIGKQLIDMQVLIHHSV